MPSDPPLGHWTTDLVDQHLAATTGRYECLDGHLVPTEPATVSAGYIRTSLAHLLYPAARAAGLVVCGPINLTCGPSRWIHPDLAVLHTLPDTDHDDRWVPARLCTLAVEITPARPERVTYCAEAGVPHYMRVDGSDILLYTLANDEYVLTGHGIPGQPLHTHTPFRITLDPAHLSPTAHSDG